MCVCVCARACVCRGACVFLCVCVRVRMPFDYISIYGKGRCVSYEN